MAAAAAHDISRVLEKLIRAEDLSDSEATEMATLISTNKLSSAQSSALLVLLRVKGESESEVAAMALAMRKLAVQPSQPSPSAIPLVDIVGTGGDGHDTVNFSTAAAVVAAACGARVAKHGNRSASSKSGSADVLEVLGVPMLAPELIGECIDRCGIAFLYAPYFHPALAALAPTRKELGIKTVFNILGPLMNPAQPRRMVLGVNSPRLLPVYAGAICKLGIADHALVVHCGGLDELAMVADSQMVEINAKQERDAKLLPLLVEPACTLADLKGGDAQYNAGVICKLLGGDELGMKEFPHCFNTIALNAGATLYVSGLADSIPHGFQLAGDAMRSGKALEKLQQWSQVANELHTRKKQKQ